MEIMYRGLIDFMTYAYTFVCKSRGKLSSDEIDAVSLGAHTVAVKAEEVLGDGSRTMTKDDRADLLEAQKIDQHIEEMNVYLQSLEIV